ncbi:MAG: hypothetical protein V1859_04905 [archaeon]
MQVYKRLPGVEKIAPVTLAIENPAVSAINDKLKETEIALSFLMHKVKEAREETRSEIVKSYESRLAEQKTLLETYKKNAEDYKQALINVDSKLVRGHQATIDKLNQRIVSYENQIKTYKKSYEEYYSLSKKLAILNQSLELENNSLKEAIIDYGQKLSEEEIKYNERLQKMKMMYENELKGALSIHVEKEVEANTYIGYLKNQLDKTHAVLKSERAKQKDVADSLQKIAFSIEGKAENQPDKSK